MSAKVGFTWRALTYDYDAIPLGLKRAPVRIGGSSEDIVLNGKASHYTNPSKTPGPMQKPCPCQCSRALQAQGVSPVLIPLSFSSHKITGMAHEALVQAASLSTPGE